MLSKAFQKWQAEAIGSITDVSRMCVVAVCIVQEAAGRGSVKGICEVINGGRPRTFSFHANRAYPRRLHGKM